jgi:hypothetical protein
MFGSVFKNTPQNETYRFNEIYNDYLNRFTRKDRDFLPQDAPIYPDNPINLSTQRQSGVANNNYFLSLPKWLSILGYTEFISFVEEYFDWLYTSNPNEIGGSGYYLTYDDIFKLIDLDKISRFDSEGRDESAPGYEGVADFIENKPLRVQVLKFISGAYAEIFANKIDPDTSEFRDFLLGIRENFYQRKTTKDALKYYFETLYSVSNANVLVYEPKKNVIRLDGGVPQFYDLPYDVGFAGDGEFLPDLFDGDAPGVGYQRLQDSYWYQDFSYLIQIENDAAEKFVIDDVAQELYKSSAHPAGYKVFFNVVDNDYVEPEDVDEDIGGSEIPILGNYIPYRLNDNQGLTYPSGCTYDLDADGSGDGFKTFAYPGWDPEILPEGFGNFGSINIGRFFVLEPRSDSPNTTLPDCP